MSLATAGSLPTYPPSAECVGCGRCCMHAPGVTLPSDWESGGEIDWAAIEVAIRSGRWCVDWWEGEIPETRRARGVYLRPAICGHEGSAVHAGWGGRCTFLSSQGCTAPRKPAGCAALKPRENPGGSCAHPLALGGDRFNRGAALAWAPHATRLEATARAIGEEQA